MKRRPLPPRALSRSLSPAVARPESLYSPTESAAIRFVAGRQFVDSTDGNVFARLPGINRTPLSPLL